LPCPPLLFAARLRVERQPNTSIGRFVRLYLRNICGYRIPPGAGDKGSIGYTFNVALAEDEDTSRVIGWPSYAMDQGFEPGKNVVTVRSAVAITPPTYSAGARAIDHVQQFADLQPDSSPLHARLPFAGSVPAGLDHESA